MYSRTKRKVHLLLDPAEGGTQWDKVFNTFIVGLIILNTIAVIFETVNGIYVPHKELFRNFEVFSVAVFSLKYILRVWSCTAMQKYKHPFRGRLKYILSTGSIMI